MDLHVGPVKRLLIRKRKKIQTQNLQLLDYDHLLYLCATTSAQTLDSEEFFFLMEMGCGHGSELADSCQNPDSNPSKYQAFFFLPFASDLLLPLFSTKLYTR